MLRVVYEITAFMNSAVVYREFKDIQKASEFIKEIKADKNFKFIRKNFKFIRIEEAQENEDN